ncbi:MAG: glycine cleavage system aminomethyltransferase GcvT [Bacillota bacterium]|nr:glycine cleavage system aminomethyltransferase GcvT [Bacillota bacterium]
MSPSPDRPEEAGAAAAEGQASEGARNGVRGPDGLLRTPLHDLERELGARMGEFAGWELPIQFSGILEEHRAVRRAAGLFDVSHMGKIAVRGREAAALLDYAATNDVARAEVGQAVYTPFCRADGGVIDDAVLYRRGEGSFLVVVNAANREKDLRHLAQLAEGFEAEVEDQTGRWGQIAVQGPEAEAILEELSEAPLHAVGSYRFLDGATVAGVSALVSRTGYTGEDGFELYADAGLVERLARAVLEAGRARGLVPAGLGARDTLRFEACLPLYGQELGEAINPLEARLGRFVKFEKGDFLGRQALERVRQEGPRRHLVGFRMVGRGIARHGYEVFRDGERAGFVTSGSYAPALDANLGLALLEGEAPLPGERLEVAIRGRRVEAEVVKLPFYRRAKAAGRGG